MLPNLDFRRDYSYINHQGINHSYEIDATIQEHLSCFVLFLIKNLYIIAFAIGCLLCALGIIYFIGRCYFLFRQNKKCSCHKNFSIGSNFSINDEDSKSDQKSTLSTVITKY